MRKNRRRKEVRQQEEEEAGMEHRLADTPRNQPVGSSSDPTNHQMTVTRHEALQAARLLS
jgi:hypothetical protein